MPERRGGRGGGATRGARRRSKSDPRGLAVDLVRRIDTDGTYANRAVPAALRGSGLDARDRHLVTELVYGTTRMRRACDHLVDRFVLRPVDPEIRAALRVGAYQLHYLRVPVHAAVDTIVAVAPGRARGFVNAVLRRVADAGTDVEWPDDATRLSYPDWIVDRLVADLGRDEAMAALAQMDEAAGVDERADGYIQDRASQWVAELVGARPGERIADLCAAPGGKATALAASGASVIAGDIQPARAKMVRENAARLGQNTLAVVVADARRVPFPTGAFDRVLLDAPCTGLGALRRRPDARWRITPDAVGRLAGLQRDMIDAAVSLVRPGGVLVYSVCTLTVTESTGVDGHGVDGHVASTWPELVPLEAPPPPWEPWGRGARLLPQAKGTDGMMILRYRKTP